MYKWVVTKDGEQIFEDETNSNIKGIIMMAIDDSLVECHADGYVDPRQALHAFMNMLLEMHGPDNFRLMVCEWLLKMSILEEDSKKNGVFN